MTDGGDLTFDGNTPPVTRHSVIVRDGNDLLISGDRSKNGDGEWAVRGYRVLGKGIRFGGLDVERTGLAAVFVEEFDADELTTDDRNVSRYPVDEGVPIAVAVDGKPAIAAWLRVRGYEREDIASLMGVGGATVREYLSRFRRQGDGFPDVDAPEVGDIVPRVPPKFRHPDARQQTVAGGSA